MNDEPVEILGLAAAAPGVFPSELSPTCGDASRGLAGPGAPSSAGAPFQGTELGLFQDAPCGPAGSQSACLIQQPCWNRRGKVLAREDRRKIFHLKRMAVKTTDCPRSVDLQFGSCIC